MADTKHTILSAEDIVQRIKRIAFQIAEDNYDEKEIYLIGIMTDGYRVAERLAVEIRQILKIEVHLYAMKLKKRNPLLKDMIYDFDIQELNDKVVIIIDDVANTGKTMLYAMKPLMDCVPKKIRVAVLVDRKHKMFPICSDYVGMSLSTTMKEHIAVDMQGEEEVAYLS